MSTINYLTVRNTIMPVVRAVTGNYSTLTGSTITGSAISVSSISTSAITVSTLNLASTMISLGQSTNQTYNNFSNGSYLTWATAKSAMTSANKTVQSANGLYQLIVANATSGLFLSSDSGITWSTLTGGLPTLTGSAYWSDGAISANGQYITLSIYGGSLWMSADYGRTFALTNQPTPSIWLPLNGSVADSMGLSVVTATGSPGYVTLNYPGYTAQAVNLANTAGAAATRYIRGTWAGATNFTVSLWFNAQSLTSVYQNIFSAYAGAFIITIANNNTLYAQIPSGGASGISNIGFTSALTVNTWYYVTVIYQTNGLCSFYVNNVLIGSVTNTQGVGSYTSSAFGLGSYDTSTSQAFNGYVDDLRITNSVSAYVPIPLLQPNIWLPFENSAGDLGSYSLPPSATPAIYLPFEGNVTDSVGSSAPVATGAVTYPQANREGYTGQAIRLTNTAGGTATQYVRGNWSGDANFTVSFWFNAQSIGAASNQMLFVAYTGAFAVYINTSNQIMYYIPSGGTALNVVTGPVVSINTWYYVTAIFQTNGVCSLYVNNSLAGTYTNSGGVGSYTTTLFAIATYDTSTPSAFNGTIDDLRIYNSAISYVPVSNTTVTGSLSYVPGVVGLNAVNLVNTAGGAATNYFTVPWTTTPNSTISMWFNLQSVAGTWCELFCADTIGLFETFIYVPTMSLVVQIPNNGAQSQPASAPITLNTWYHLVQIFQTNGTCSVFLNGVSIGSITNTNGTTGTSWTNLTIGRETGSNASAFNGYIDDFRIYNAAIPYHVLFPQNYRSLALSGTGQYALATAASGWVVGSSDSSRTWSKQAVCVGTQNELVQPNLSGLTGNTASSTPVSTTWAANGVIWTASASSVNSPGFQPWVAFNNIAALSGIVPYSWATPTVYNTSGTYTGSVTTTVLGGIGAVTGEWLQIQSSVPLVMTSYAYAVADYRHTPKTGYIVGSNDGMTWYPIQNISMITNPLTTNWTSFASYIVVNQNGTQTIQGGQAGSGTFTPYPTTTNAYTYFRVIGTSVWPNVYGNLEFTEWYINFARVPTQALSMNHTGQYQLVATGPAAGSIMPNQTGLVTSTWSQGGVNWGVSASASEAGYAVYNVFSNSNTVGWIGNNVTPRYTNGATNGNAALTTIQTIGSTAGEWVQIQSSVPLVLTSFALGIGVNPYPFTNTPKTYYIIGSNDGSTWYPLQFGNFTISAFTGASVFINMNTTGTQTLTSTMVGSVATTAYSFTTNAYTYFRLIGTSLLYTAAGGSYMELGEWFLNFQNSVSYSTNYGSTWLNTSRTVSNESVALSASGQYALSTNSVVPLARLTLDNTNVDAQGVLAPTTGAGTVTYSTSIKAVGSHSAFFNQTAGSTTPTMYLNYIVPTVLNTPSVLTMSCWMYVSTMPASGISIPMSFSDTANTVGGVSFFIGTGGTYMRFAYTATISGYAELNYSPSVLTNSWYHLVGVASAGVTQFYVNGTLIGSGTYSGLLCLTGGVNMSRLMVGAQYTSGQFAGAFHGYVDDVRLYTSALNADEINSLYNNPALTQTVAVSSSYLPITGYSEPTLPGITANIVDAAVSQTGQYMVAVTSSTTNNVYYSTDYGATFTALTVGSLAMVSCSISYDGSYLTVESATTVHTLNRNTRGFSVTVGNQAGLINQAQNAIAIGDKAGRTNQSANSIVLNASGVALDAVAPGFYVAPIATAGSSSAAPFSLLGYGTDNQIVQTGIMSVSGTVQINSPIVSFNSYNGGYPLNGSTFVRNSIGAYFGTRDSIVSRGCAIDFEDVNTNGSYPIEIRGGQLKFYTCDVVQQGVNASVRMTIAPNGNVGIGVTAPSYPLHVVGAGVFGQSTSRITLASGLGIGEKGLYMVYDGTNNVGYIQSERQGVAYTPLFLNPFGGNVGINTTNPTASLHVLNSTTNTVIAVDALAANQAILSLRKDGTQKCSIYVPNNSNTMTFYNDTAGVNNFVLGPGFIQISQYTQNGTVTTINGTGQLFVSSDRRVKENIEYLSDTQQGLTSILNLKPATYRLIGYSDTYLGFIAQDLEQDIPLAVDGKKYEWQWDAMEDGTPKFDANGDIVYKLDADGNRIIRTRGVMDRAIIATQTLAIQELSKQLSSTQEQLAEKSSKLDALLAWAQTQGFAL